MQEQPESATREKPQGVLVKRNGARVWIGPPRAQGYVMHWRNARAAREAHARFVALLTDGWNGTLDELMREVQEKVDAGQRLVDARTAAAVALEIAEDNERAAAERAFAEAEAAVRAHDATVPTRG